MGALCIGRFFDETWRSSHSRTRLFPLVLGAACVSWALGDVALTMESLGGATPAVPSAADGRNQVRLAPALRRSDDAVEASGTRALQSAKVSTLTVRSPLPARRHALAELDDLWRE